MYNGGPDWSETAWIAVASVDVAVVVVDVAAVVVAVGDVVDVDDLESLSQESQASALFKPNRALEQEFEEAMDEQ